MIAIRINTGQNPFTENSISHSASGFLTSIYNRVEENFITQHWDRDKKIEHILDMFYDCDIAGYLTDDCYSEEFIKQKISQLMSGEDIRGWEDKNPFKFDGVYASVVDTDDFDSIEEAIQHTATEMVCGGIEEIAEYTVWISEEFDILCDPDDDGYVVSSSSWEKYNIQEKTK